MEVDRYQQNGLSVTIHTDDDPPNPRRMCDHVGTMVCWHRRYLLGDKHEHRNPAGLIAHLIREVLTDEQARPIVLALVVMDRRIAREELRDCRETGNGYKDYAADVIAEDLSDPGPEQAAMEALEEAGLVILPLNLYDHGGITMSTTGFSCPWDSGQVGYIHCAPGKIADEWGGHSDAKAKATACLEAEVKEYDQYLTGQVYGHVIEDDEGNHLDSCWGFYGEDAVREAAKSEAAAIASDASRYQGAAI
jgi:hypothetical protein